MHLWMKECCGIIIVYDVTVKVPSPIIRSTFTAITMTILTSTITILSLCPSVLIIWICRLALIMWWNGWTMYVIMHHPKLPNCCWETSVIWHTTRYHSPILCCGTFSDTWKVVDSASGKALADKHGMKFFEVSAQSGTNVVEAFECLAKDLVLASEQQHPSAAKIETGQTIHLASQQAAPKKKCC